MKQIYNTRFIQQEFHDSKYMVMYTMLNKAEHWTIQYEFSHFNKKNSNMM